MAVCQVCNANLEGIGAPCRVCAEANRPFKAKYLEEEGKRQDIISLRLNEAERAKLEEIKELLDIPLDGKALKFMCWAGYKVLLSTFGAEIIGFLCEGNRTRLGVGKRKKRDFFKDL